MTVQILDPCCGTRMMWHDRQNPQVVFGDLRSETITVTDRSHGKQDGTRTLHIEPDVQMDFTDMPFPGATFNLVSFDPPHLVRAGDKSWLKAKYGKLGDNWRDDLRKGFEECLRVLKPGGVLVFKWNETQVKIGEVLKLAPVKPLFGHLSGRKGLTHWMVFIKQGGEPLDEDFKDDRESNKTEAESIPADRPARKEELLAGDRVSPRGCGGYCNNCNGKRNAVKGTASA